MYVSGETGPSLLAVVRLSSAAGFNLDWVCTGVGSPRRDNAPAVPASPPLDARFFGRVTDAIAKAYKEAGVELSCLELGQLAATEYQTFAPLASTEDEQISVAALIKTKHARMLASESLAERKRGA
jgi:hypothetical protein